MGLRLSKGFSVIELLVSLTLITMGAAVLVRFHSTYHDFIRLQVAMHDNPGKHAQLHYQQLVEQQPTTAEPGSVIAENSWHYIDSNADGIDDTWVQVPADNPIQPNSARYSVIAIHSQNKAGYGFYESNTVVVNLPLSK